MPDNTNPEEEIKIELGPYDPSEDGFPPIGLYDEEHETITEANRHLKDTMVRVLPNMKKSSKILMIGPACLQAAIWISEEYGCKIDVLSPDEARNKTDRKLLESVNLHEKITITTGGPVQLPYDREYYELVWSQDILLYSEDRLKTFREVARILQSGGRFIFTDIMETENCEDRDGLDQLLAAMPVEEFPSIIGYKNLARKSDLERVIFKRRPAMLETHYEKVIAALEKTKGTKTKRLRAALEPWLAAAKSGCLTWGILCFQKRNV